MTMMPHDFSAIEALDLEPIKFKLMHPKAGEGWSQQRASAVEREYRRFLYLMKKYPNERTSPLVDVDIFWHYHILDTRKYAADCQQVFGYFLHHFPYVGMRGKEDEEALQRMGEHMREVYEATFGEAYARGMANAGKTALSAGVSAGGAYGGAKGHAAGQPAYCTVTADAPAYCTVTADAPAYCTVTADAPAYCTVTADAPAYCTVTADAPAYCTVTAGGPAYCTAPAAEPAYCTFAIDAAAYCTKGQDDPPLANAGDGGKLPEYRAGFFLERPRLTS